MPALVHHGRDRGGIEDASAAGICTASVQIGGGCYGASAADSRDGATTGPVSLRSVSAATTSNFDEVHAEHIPHLLLPTMLGQPKGIGRSGKQRVAVPNMPTCDTEQEHYGFESVKRGFWIVFAVAMESVNALCCFHLHC